LKVSTLTNFPNEIEQVDDVLRLLCIFRIGAQRKDIPDEDFEWCSLKSRRRMDSRGYIRSTVEREIVQGIQCETMNVSKEKVMEIHRVLARKRAGEKFDEKIDHLYI